ncbi:MAG: chemotaxis protein CheA [Geobacteraceae bacterium]|nr:chemotaxis protein CheA [Geobacteraceae bacterium]
MHRQAFREEAFELLTELENALLELEENPHDQDLLGRSFRAMHTIKGSGAMFGYTAIAEFTHDIETVFDQIRNGSTNINRELIDKTLRSCDLIRVMLDDETAVSESERSDLTDYFHKLNQNKAAKGVNTSISRPSPADQSTAETEKIYRISFKPAPDIFFSGIDPLGMLNELRLLGTCSIVAHLDRIPPLEDIQPDHCYTYWDVILTTTREEHAIRDVFIFIEDSCELKIECIVKMDSFADEQVEKRLGEILVERGELTEENIAGILKQKKRLGEMLVETGLTVPSKVAAALVEQQQVREVHQKRQTTEAASSLRVPSEKLDTLVNLVGELVTVQARLTQTAAVRNDPQLANIAEEVERLTAELRESTLTIRMMPIGTCFSKFRRLVRDLSAELGKEVEMITDGAETELDKTVIERLNDPLVHIIRNSLDHGIEPAEIRERIGKPRHGTIRISAKHSGDSVVLTIHDDGAGLDAAVLRTKAIDRKLIPANAELAESELFHLIFAAGFSTATKVTGISGRGVGMDVVKKAIDSLRGQIFITSKNGQGTTITIRLPLTLAIIESLLVKIQDSSFVMPLSVVEECVELNRSDSTRAAGRLLPIRGTLVPYVPLRERFGLSGSAPLTEQVVIANVEGKRIGFVVDQVIGQHQTVIKSLGTAYRNVAAVSGATILGDGSVAMILDIPKLMIAEENICISP